MTPEDLVTAAERNHRARNGIPDAAAMRTRERAEDAVRAALGADLVSLSGSPLGIAWTEELRAVVRTMPTAADLERRGWLSLDRLASRLGLGGSGRWLVREAGARGSRGLGELNSVVGPVLAAVRLVPLARHDAGGTGQTGDPVREVLDGAARRGEVRLKDVLELRGLREQRCAFPDTSSVLTAAADAEIGLGSRTLVRWTSGRRRAAPVPLRRVPGHRVVVAVSGVDGAGKSTLLEELSRGLQHCGLPVARVWLRPGMGLGPLAALAGRVKRRRGDQATPGIALVAADPDRVLPARTGAVGWVWSMLVTVAFLAGVRRQHAAAHGVVLYDRHLLDALVTLDFGYAGTDLRAQRWLVRHLLPRASLTLLLELPAEEAVRRKAGDPIGEAAVRRQLEAYADWLPRLRRLQAVARLDATRPPDEICAEALERLLAISR